ncbi:MAG: hypothetical protein NC114_11140, partial [Ruminococcus flavefaciens]|nr:hypothetical protein [Ruminococcus flavefaciens]
MKKSKSALKKIALSLAVASVMACGTAVTLTGCKKDKEPSGSEQTLPVTVTIGQTVNGSVTADKSSYVFGDTVTLTITPDTGYELGSIKIGETDKTASVRNGVLVLDNVTENITVTAVFNARTAATLSATVKGSTGGTATLSATSAYVGDTVTLTLTPEAGYDVISVKVNGSEKVGDLNGGRTLSITVTEATTSVEVEFYAIPVSASLVFDSEYGTAAITDEKPAYVLGDTIEVTFTPEDKCELVSVLVNGEEKIEQVENNKLTITVSGVGNINVTVVFDLTPATCEFGVTATRFGAAYDVKGAEVVFEHKTLDRTYKTTVNSDGKIETELVPGTYSMAVAGCIPVEVEVTESGVADAKQVIYQIFNENNLSGTVDVSQPNKVTLQSAYAWITSADSFTGDTIFTTSLKHTSVATYFAIGFIGDSGNSMVAVTSEGNAEKLHFKKYGDVLFGGAQFVYGSEYSAGLTSDEQAAFTGADGLTLKAVRKGNVLCIMVGDGTTDRLLESWDISDCAGQPMQFGMCTFGSDEYSFTVSASHSEDEIEGLLATTVTVADGIEHGSVTLDRTDGKYYLGEAATLTITPDDTGNENTVYVLKSLTIGRTDITDKVESGVCEVKITDKSLQISAEFELVSYANLSVKVGGIKFGAAQTIDKVWLSGVNYTRTQHSLVEGVLAVEKLTEGEYTVEADGYLPAKINVSGGAVSYADITLVYRMFQSKDGWNLDTLADGYITRTDTGNSNAKLFFKDKFTDFVFTTTVKYSQARQMFQIKLSDGKVVGFSTVDDENNIIQFPGNSGSNWWTAWDTPWHTASSGWGNFQLTSDEITAYTGESGIEIKVVRKVIGDTSKIYIFVGNRLACTYNNTNFLGGEVDCAVVPIKTGESISFPVAMSTNTTEIDSLVLAAVTAQLETGSSGTLSLDRTDGKYYLGETATVTIETPADADVNTVYTVKTLTVNGEDKKADVTAINGGFALDFTVTEKTVAVVAELERTTYTDLSVNISGLKYGVGQNITSVTLKNAAANYDEVHTLTGGTLAVQHLIPGTYTVEVTGYIPATIAVADGATYNDIVLNYQIFDENKHGSIDITTAQSTYQVNSWDVIKLKDTFTGDFVYTVSVQHRNQGGVNRLYMVARFEGNSVLCIGANNDNWHGIHCMDVGADAVYGGDASDYTYIDSWTGMVLTDAEWTADQNGKLMLKLVRKGNNVYLIVGHTDESGTYSERLFKSWQGEQYAKAVDFGYVNTTNSSFTTPIKVSVNTNDVNALVGNKNLNIGITFNKYGTAQTDITSVKLNDTDYQLTEGKLVVSDLPMGFYTISAEGYAPHTLNLLSNDNIVMQYELIGT